MQIKRGFPGSSRFLLSFLFLSATALAAGLSETSPIHDLQAALRTNAASAIEAAHALAKMGPAAKPATGDLVGALRFDEESVTGPVGDALLAIGPEAVPPLILGLKDANFFMRQRSSIILGRFGPKAKSASRPLAQLVLDSTYQVSTAASQSLVQIGPDALPSISGVFDQQDEKGQVVLLDVVGGIGAPSNPFLLKALAKSDSTFVRVKAAELLGTIRPSSPEVVSGLMDALNNLDERVRLSAVDGLTELEILAKPAIGALIVASQTDNDPLVRQKAMDAIPAIGPATAASLPGLGRAFHSPQVEVRTAVVTALAGCKDDPAHTLALLLAAAHDPEPSVQTLAQSAVTKLQSAAPPAASTAAAPAKH